MAAGSEKENESDWRYALAGIREEWASLAKHGAKIVGKIEVTTPLIGGDVARRETLKRISDAVQYNLRMTLAQVQLAANRMSGTGFMEDFISKQEAKIEQMMRKKT